MTLPRVSVCVVSWHRPEALERCLTALGQLDYPNFEIVVVADAAALAGLAHDLTIKRALAREPNISAARNVGIIQAGGDIVAFIDDDAVPEPSWLRYLCTPFSDAGVSATGGFVRGRNGISWQWRGRAVNALGETRDHEPGAALPEGFACKTEGTNMAVRRDVLSALGGFDEAFHFYLDETDLNLRLHAAGHRTVLVPDAEVHHGFFASARRRKDRVPLDLRQIGASWSVFLRKHVGETLRDGRLQAVRSDEEARLIRHMVSGGLEPRGVRRLRKSFDAGVREGRERVFGEHVAIPDSGVFHQYPSQTRRHECLVCRPRTYAQTLRIAQTCVSSGKNVTIFNLSRTGCYHYITYRGEGVWVHTGGVFGKSERCQPIFRLWRRAGRVAAELRRIRKVRNIADIN